MGFVNFPATGGLFLGDEDINSNISGVGRFWDSQDQRNSLRTRYRHKLPRHVWLGLGAEYGSGLPVEFEGTEEEALTQYGSAVVSRVDLARGRVRPQFSLDASVGADLYRSDRLALCLQADVENLNNRLNVIDFAGLFSGNAIGAPRSGFVRLQTDFLAVFFRTPATSLRSYTSRNDGQDQRGRMLAIVVDQVGGLHDLPAGFRVFAGIEIPVKTRKITAGDLHAQLVALQEDVGG